ncbi:MAG: acyl carrier protein [Candidatus Binataceae bacterium]
MDIELNRDPEESHGLTAQAIEAWLVTQLAERLSIDRNAIEPTRPLGDYGLDSIDAVGLVGDIERYLKRQLSPTLTYEHANLRTLAQHLAETRSPVPTLYAQRRAVLVRGTMGRRSARRGVLL